MLFVWGLLVGQGLGPEPWLWWTPPAAISLEERKGVSLARIAGMSQAEWGEYTYKHEMLPVEGANDAYGVALRAQNRRQARRMRPADRVRIEQIRRAAFRYGMACIALEDSLAGGGTYANHSPHWLFASEERMIRALVFRWPAKPMARGDLSVVRRGLAHYRELKTAPFELLYEEKRAQLQRVHLYARLALDYGDRLRTLSVGLEPSIRGSVDRFIAYWGKDYLRIRTSDEEIP